MKQRILIIFFVLFSVSFSGFAAAGDETVLSNRYNMRYCEIATMKKGEQLRDFFTLYVDVYNTVGLNDCPDALWKNLTTEEIEKTLTVKKALLNGPRYFLMNTIVGSGPRITKPDIVVGGLTMKKGAQLKLSVWQAISGEKNYKPKKVNRARSTVFIFNTGTEVYQLISATGDVYVMQSYSQAVDPHMTVSDLKNLGKRLDLPKDWQYTARKLDQPLKVHARNGEAYVISDDFHNMYQKIVN